MGENRRLEKRESGLRDNRQTSRGLQETTDIHQNKENIKALPAGKDKTFKLNYLSLPHPQSLFFRGRKNILFLYLLSKKTVKVLKIQSLLGVFSLRKKV